MEVGEEGDNNHSAPIARQINQIPAVINQEMVDADCFAYRSTPLYQLQDKPIL